MEARAPAPGPLGPTARATGPPVTVPEHGPLQGASPAGRDSTSLPGLPSSRPLADSTFRALVAQLSVGVALLRGDPGDPDDLTIEYVNEAGTKLLGGGDADLTGRPIADLLGADVRRGLATRLRATPDRDPHHLQPVMAVSGRAESEKAESDGVAREGDDASASTRTIAIHARVLLLPGQFLPEGPCAVQLELVDVTPWVETEARLRTSEETLRLSFEGALASMVWTSLSPADPGRIVRVNAALCGLLGHDEPELLKKTFPELAHDEEAGESRAIVEAMTTGWLTSWRGERRLRHADGHDVWTLVSSAVIADPSGVPMCLSQVEDITARKEAEARLAHQALHDALTGLPNRHLLQDHLDQALTRARRCRSQVAVLFVDVDDFKAVNDAMGHTAGDELLVEIGRLLRSALRGNDTAARIGGDEFVLVCEDLTEPEEVRPIAERLIALFDRELIIRGHAVSVSVSIGVAVGGPDATAEDLLREADAAMHRGKRRGKGHWEPADRSLQASAARQIQVGAGLRHAIDSGGFVLHYQPIVALETGRLTGVEALLRWQHPARGLLLPEEFLDVAEERLLIVAIGAWALHDACQQAARWRSRFGRRAPSVGVNISSHQVGRDDLVHQVRNALEASGLPADELCLEITERQVIDLVGAKSAELRCVTDLGVRLSIDDFGTGYAGFAYLRELAIDSLKIDRSFVAGLGRDRTATAVARSLAELGQDLDLTVVAEGVETACQRDVLAGFGCPMGQGKLWRMAVPPEQIDELLERPDSLWVPADPCDR